MKAIERLYEYLEYKDIKPGTFEKQMRLSQGYLSKMYNRKSDIGESIFLQIIENCPEIDLLWLMTGKGEMLKREGQPANTDTTKCGAVTISNIGQIAPASQIIAEQSVPLFDIQLALSNSEQLIPKNFIYIPDLPRCDGAIRMYGDQMSPALKGGDIIIYRKVKDLSKDFFWGQMYLLSFDDDGDEHVVVKYVHRSDEDNSVKLVSENKQYMPTDIPRDSIRAMAEIKASIRYNTMM